MTLEEARKDIDIIDQELKDLFLKRMAVAKSIAEIKAVTGDEIYKPDREALIIDKMTSDVDESIKPLYIDFIKKMLEISRNYQYQIIEGLDNKE
ncbi:MAG: chorismate mutase [Eubacterium sp.]|nr:chorismate mutase [Eubacterium sp.]